MDTLSPRERSVRMGRVKGKDTKPEMAVRHLIYRLGLRYRLHCAGLPGKPDLVFARRKCVSFVLGCFWPRQADCWEGRIPKLFVDYWVSKLNKNQIREATRRAPQKRKGGECLSPRNASQENWLQ